MSKTILVVDDEPVQRRLLEAALSKSGYEPVCASSGEEALEILQAENSILAVILDLVMPGMGGMEVLEKLDGNPGHPPVIVQTAQGGIDVVVNAMRLGAFDFVVKPFTPDKLIRTVERAVRFKGVATTRAPRQVRTSSGNAFKDMVSRSRVMEPVLAVMRKAAGSNIPVLIEGESGVGKEMVARAVHEASPRAGRKLVTVNCGALPENLVESLLFGHEKGAFTGASEKHVGKFEEANGGTLFLDEIGELPLELQVKLLRAIQEGEVDPIGARRPVKVDVRLISATNRNLMQLVSEGAFREDLYYRLSVFPVTLPPLRERREDIEPLIYHFVKKIGREQGRNHVTAIRPEVLAALTSHDWPGNIRELENAIFRAMILCEGEELTLAEFPQIEAQLPGFRLPDQEVDRAAAGGGVAAIGMKISADAPGLATPDDLDLQIGGLPEPAAPPATWERRSGLPVSARGDMHRPTVSPTSNYGMISLIGSDGQSRQITELEADAIRFALEIYKGRMSEVARRLGIGRSTLYRKLRELGIETTDG
ncbi:MAG: sigma-54-dependent Fis family transcriptional regulator [Nitratireductor sp.]|nr:sigma-54-dependent Fis family transcriptional regulator [Nitratireductor sp.]